MRRGAAIYVLVVYSIVNQNETQRETEKKMF